MKHFLVSILILISTENCQNWARDRPWKAAQILMWLGWQPNLMVKTLWFMPQLLGHLVTLNHLAGSEEGNKHLQGAGHHTICRNNHNQSADCGDTFRQLSEARKLGILDLSPEDEVEGELLYHQLQLLGTAVSRKQLSGDFTVHFYLHGHNFTCFLQYIIYVILS